MLWDVASVPMDTIVEAYHKWNVFVPRATVQRFVQRLTVTGTPEHRTGNRVPNV